MPEQIAKRMGEYVKANNFFVEDRLFPISYSTERMFIRKLGRTLNLTISPHDLRLILCNLCKVVTEYH
jgi:hypothetical protein